MERVKLNSQWGLKTRALTLRCVLAWVELMLICALGRSVSKILYSFGCLSDQAVRQALHRFLLNMSRSCKKIGLQRISALLFSRYILAKVSDLPISMHIYNLNHRIFIIAPELLMGWTVSGMGFTLLLFCNRLGNILILLQAVALHCAKQRSPSHKVQWSFSLVSLHCYLKRICTLPKAQAYARKCCCVFKGRRREARLAGFAAEGQNDLQEFLNILTYVQHTQVNVRSEVDFATLKNTTQRESWSKTTHF